MSSHLITLNQSNPDIGKGLLKLTVFITLGAITTLAIFWVMSRLVAFEGEPPVVAIATPLINPVMDEVDSKLETRQKLPEPPKPIEKPPQQMPDVEDLSPDDGMDGFGSGFQVAAPSISTDVNTDLSMSAGGDARPIVRISPRYPIPAARDGIEGWVRLSFTINETGGVEDVTVIDAEPARVFNREAIRALRRWKYKPKAEEGRAVKQTGMVVELTFTLDGEQAQ